MSTQYQEVDTTTNVVDEPLEAHLMYVYDVLHSLDTTGWSVDDKLDLYTTMGLLLRKAKQ